MMLKQLIAMLLALCLTATCFLFASSAAAIPGDVNSDGKVGSDDARLTLRASVRLERITKGSAAFTAADVNRDGVIGSDDARNVLRGSVGLENLAALNRSVDWILTNNAQAWQYYSNKAVLAAYYAKVKQLTALSGAARIDRFDSWDNSDSLAGVSVVRLVDMDRDGTPELYCAYSESASSHYSDRQALYRYVGRGQVEALYDGVMTNNGSDYSPLVWFREKNGTTYFVGGMCFDRLYFQLENGKFLKTEFSTDYAETGTVNGKTMPLSQFTKELAKYEDGGTDAKIWIYDYTKGAVSSYNAVIKETTNVINLLNQ